MKKNVNIGVSYYPEQWPRERWQYDLDMMKEAKISVIRLAELAWSYLEPEEGHYEFTWLDDFIALAYKAGMHVIIGTPTEASPPWLNSKHPNNIAMDEYGHKIGGRNNHCQHCSCYKDYSRKIVETLANHYKDNPAVIGWQIDNELHAVKCFCDDCNAAFRTWLQQRYGTLKNLNEAWGCSFWSHIYTRWDEVRLPSKDQYTPLISQRLDHSRFASYSCTNFLKTQVDILKSVAPHQFVTHNTMGVIYLPLNIYEVSEPLDFISWDNYTNVDDDNFIACFSNDLARGAKHKNFWILEQRNGFLNYCDYNLAIEPGIVRLWGLQGVARGADGVVFYRWRSGRFGSEQNPNGLLRHDGTPRRAYFETGTLAKELDKIDDKLADTKVTANVALLFSYDAAWALEHHPQYPSFDYIKVVMTYHKMLVRMGITVDIVDPHSDLSGYKLVVAPCLMMADLKLQYNLENYVKNGGNMVFGPRSGNKTWNANTIDIAWPGLLSNITGIEIDEFEVLPNRLSNTVEYNGTDYEINAWVEMIKCVDADSIGTYCQKFYAGRTAISKNKYGEGTTTYIGAMGNDNLIYDVLNDTVKACSIETLELPSGIFVTKRESATLSFTFILNFNRDKVVFNMPILGTNLNNGMEINGTIEIDALDGIIIEHHD